MSLLFIAFAWGMVISAIWTLIYNWKTGYIYVRTLHQIPCYKCKYFTNSCYLKCTVNPQIACSETAIDCRDYEPIDLRKRFRLQ